ncbi:hypothetical protein ENTCAN_08817 [Enterobacter cancerogenus ATCC 35316]|nr:hypothetical protein ENTCAN_08817 [Enterobacter cancerogenus ATCC 35316]
MRVESLRDVIVSCLNSEIRSLKLRDSAEKCQAGTGEDMDYFAAR